jgi:hypothetical protein
MKRNKRDKGRGTRRRNLEEQEERGRGTRGRKVGEAKLQKIEAR